MRKRSRTGEPTVKAPWQPRDYLFAGIALSVIGGFLLVAGIEADTDGASLGFVAAVVLLSVGGLMTSIATVAYGVFAGMDYYHYRAGLYELDDHEIEA